MKLSYDVQGRGDRPLLLLHGFTGSRTSFATVQPALEQQFRVIRVDLPGHGESPLPTRSGKDGFLETLDALGHVLDEVGAQDADIVGYSQGARVALGFALDRPSRVGRLVLESGSPGLHRRKERIERRRADDALASRILEDGVDAFVAHWEALPLFEGLRRLPAPEQAALRVRRTGSTAEGLAGALRCLGVGVQPDYWPLIWKLRCPTLLLTGGQDDKFTRIARRMSADLPMVWSHAFAGVGHAPHLEVPEAWTHEVINFLRTPWFEVPVVDDAEIRSNA